MPVDCHQCGEPIEITTPPHHPSTLHFHGRCYSQFLDDYDQGQSAPATAGTTEFVTDPAAQPQMDF